MPICVAFGRIEELRQSPLQQAIHIHQMIETVNPGRHEGIGKKRRRQRSRDVGANQSKQHLALAHDTPSTGAKPQPRMHL
jgi:hypothetical protein